MSVPTGGDFGLDVVIVLVVVVVVIVGVGDLRVVVVVVGHISPVWEVLTGFLVPFC